jgi:hypothetical protein
MSKKVDPALKIGRRCQRQPLLRNRCKDVGPLNGARDLAG